MSIIDILGCRVRFRTDMVRDVFLGTTYTRSSSHDPWRVLSTNYLMRAAPGKYFSRDLCVDSVHPGPPYRSGGALYIHSYNDPRRSASNIGVYPAKVSTLKYEGGFGPYLTPYGLGGFSNLGTLDNWCSNKPSGMDGYGDCSSQGASAWSKFKPNRSVADAGVFLAELRDVPRMLKTTAKGFSDIWRGMGGNMSGFGPKHVADHFLNTQFGWLPFINDLRKFYRAYKTLDSRLARIKRMNGQWEKRGGSFSSGSTTVVVDKSMTVTAHIPNLNSNWYSPGAPAGSYERSVTTSQKVWFEASFKYYIPEWKFEDDAWKARTVAEIFGLEPNPYVVWEATPWSWLADWFTNAGDCLSNMSDGWAENLVAKYAFLMATTETVGKLSSTLNLWTGHIQDTWLWTYSSKTRSPASPFGFGLTSSDLSARQLAILTALGISRQF